MTPPPLHIRAAYSLLVETPGETGQGEIQWMPPGSSTIKASVNGQPGQITVKATAETAQLVDARIKTMLAEGEEPYLDFNHEDGEASAWPISASWGGDDKKTGGVRLQLAWSDSGRAAVRGKRFTKFSPEFFAGKDGVVSGVGLNLGGLVNRPAFTTIQKVSAKSGSTGGAVDTVDPTPAAGANPPMKEVLKMLVKLGLISSEDLSESAVVGELSARSHEIKEGLQVRAKLTTDYVPKFTHDALVAELGNARKTNAELVVAKAVADGKIAPKDDTVKARFVQLLTADPTHAELLEAMPVAFTPPAPVIQASRTDRDYTGGNLARAGEFEQLIKARAAKDQIPEDEAISLVAWENPKAYDAYNTALLAKGGK